MAEKILNTRIQLKYDSWAKWEAVKETFKPLKGEVCIVNPGTATGSVANVPCLMKVGDGENFFKDLPWVSAPAADVHAWAKAAALPVVRNDGKDSEGNDKAAGNVISSISWNNDGIEFTTASVATSEGMAQLQKDLDAVEKDIADNRATWELTYSVAKTEKGFTFTPSAGDGVTVTFDYVASGELTEILKNYYTKAEVDELIQGVRDEIPTELGVMSVELLPGEANGTLKLKVNDVEGEDVAVTGLEEIKVKNATHADSATKVDTALTVKVGGADVVFDGSEAKTADVDAAIAAVFAEEKDTQTAVKAAGNYVVVNGPAALVEDELNEYTISINEDALKTLIGEQTTAAMEFKGATAVLPENPAKGDMYKVAGDNIDITIGGVAAKVGDAIVYNGTEWFLIPSGDDIEDTWRPVKVGENILETSETLEFVAGDNVTITEEGGKVTIASSYVDTQYTADEATLTLNGTVFSVKEIPETKLEKNTQDALALARTALQEHQSLENYKTKQEVVGDKGLTGANVLAKLSQNANGEIAYETRELAPADIGAATSAQGEKADSAIQSITAGTGLAVSDKDDNNGVVISIDDAVTFIFNCGDAAGNPLA